MAFESEPLPYIGFGLPSTIVYLIGNVITQYPFSTVKYLELVFTLYVYCLRRGKCISVIHLLNALRKTKVIQFQDFKFCVEKSIFYI